MQKSPSDFYDDKKSYVAKDKIWKDHCEKITVSARKWPQNWGFLNGRLEDIGKNLNQDTKKLQPEISIKPPCQSSIKSPRSVPKTTSGMIGWLSTDKLYQLEKYGRYSRGKQTITKSFNWPAEGVN